MNSGSLCFFLSRPHARLPWCILPIGILQLTKHYVTTFTLRLGYFDCIANLFNIFIISQWQQIFFLLNLNILNVFISETRRLKSFNKV